MYEETKAGLEEAQVQVKHASKTIMETNRSVLRNYLKAAFELQRAGLETLEALQKGAEELTFNVVDRAEEMQDKAVKGAETRLRESAQRLRDARERAQANLGEGRDDVEENSSKLESRLRDGAEIATKVAKVIETRIETMLSELLDMGRRELEEIEDRIDALVDRLDAELEDQVHPITNYDEKNVDEVTGELKNLDEMQLRTVRAYEVSNKNRITVLRAVDEQMADLAQTEPVN
ncbi:MAG: hypothetical protein H0T73_14530 [Ardenticatenales bacterium]|nr:hypothetical protein [Ardenticatenales bacterium]